VAVFVEVIPDVKRRQFKQAVDAYEALRRTQAQANRETAVMDKPHSQRVQHKQGQKRKQNRVRKDG